MANVTRITAAETALAASQPSFTLAGKPGNSVLLDVPPPPPSPDRGSPVAPGKKPQGKKVQQQQAPARIQQTEVGGGGDLTQNDKNAIEDVIGRVKLQNNWVNQAAGVIKQRIGEDKASAAADYIRSTYPGGKLEGQIADQLSGQ